MKVFESPAFLSLPLVERAKHFAHFAHDSIDQKRKYTHQPYWVHTDKVAELTATVTNDEEVIAAAHLHDVVEDVFPLNPYFSLETIAKLFGQRVALFVDDLTDKFTKEAYPHLNRVKRKSGERKRLGLIEPESQTVKLADLIANTADIVPQDPNFAKVYIAEKLALLPFLILGDPRLWVEASQQGTEAAKQLGI